MDRVNILLWAVTASLEMHPDRSLDERTLPADLCPNERKELLARLTRMGFYAYIREFFTSGQIGIVLVTERYK